MNIRKALQHLLHGADINETLDNLLEVVSDAHQALGRLKKGVRDVDAIFRRTGLTTPAGKERADPRTLAALNTFKDIKDFALTLRVPKIVEMAKNKESTEWKALVGLPHLLDTFSRIIIKSNLASTLQDKLLLASMSATEAADRLIALFND